jgi:hypothetical protein
MRRPSHTIHKKVLKMADLADCPDCRNTSAAGGTDLRPWPCETCGGAGVLPVGEGDQTGQHIGKYVWDDNGMRFVPDPRSVGLAELLRPRVLH